MKTFMLVLLASLSSVFLIAQPVSKRKKANMQVEVRSTIEVPADQAWQVLGKQFAEIDVWSTTIESSHIPTADQIPDEIIPAPHAPVLGRTTQSKALEATEILTAYSDEERSFTFEGVGLPKFLLAYAVNQSQVIAVDATHSELVFKVSMRFKGPFLLLSPLMKKRMGKVLAGIQSDLETYLQGQPTKALSKN